MSLFKKKRPLCEVEVCDNFLPEGEECGMIVVGDHEFKVCDECYKLMDNIQIKFEDREDEYEPF